MLEPQNCEPGDEPTMPLPHRCSWRPRSPGVHRVPPGAQPLPTRFPLLFSPRWGRGEETGCCVVSTEPSRWDKLENARRTVTILWLSEDRANRTSCAVCVCEAEGVPLRDPGSELGSGFKAARAPPSPPSRQPETKMVTDMEIRQGGKLDALGRGRSSPRPAAGRRGHSSVLRPLAIARCPRRRRVSPARLGVRWAD